MIFGVRDWLGFDIEELTRPSLTVDCFPKKLARLLWPAERFVEREGFFGFSTLEEDDMLAFILDSSASKTWSRDAALVKPT